MMKNEPDYKQIKTTAIIGLFLISTGIIIFFHYKSNEYVLLFPEFEYVSSSEIENINDILKKNKFRYKKIEYGHNTFIHPKERTKALIMLASKRLPRKGFPIPNPPDGYYDKERVNLLDKYKDEHFKQYCLGKLDHSIESLSNSVNPDKSKKSDNIKRDNYHEIDNKIKTRILLEKTGEFERIIGDIDGVKNVTISSYKEINAPWGSYCKVNVRIKTTEGNKLDQKTVGAIKYLMSYFIKGIEFDYISIEYLD